MMKWCLSAVLTVMTTVCVLARPAATCAGIAMLGGAQLICSQTDPHAASQFCNYSWALVTSANVTQVVQGSFLLPTGASNIQIYQGSGFDRASSNPIVLCHGERPTE
jgi:hypothetical protein